ncbi:hypothetical protein V5799_000869 [Amblyomma americanum]|uniref:RNA helicase n=1 Tax=Amblyomma americanum TaxID=6943 RepID=A0AAQ4D1U7_AMBAM
MFTLLGKAISAFLDNFCSPDENTKCVRDNCGAAAEESTFTENDGELIFGEVTHINPIEQYGLINEEFYFKLSLAAGEHLVLNTKVLFRLEPTGRQVRELSVLPAPPPSSMVAKVTKVGIRCLHLLDVATPAPLLAGFDPEFKVRSGDWLRLCFDPSTGSVCGVEALRSKELVGEVTRLTSTGGAINQQIAFSIEQWPSEAPKPRVGLQVTVQAIESDQGNLSWRALSVEPYMEEAAVTSLPSPLVQNGVTEDNNNLSSVPEGLDVPRVIDFGQLKPGQSHTLQLCITNTTDRPHLLLACKLHSTSKQVALAEAFKPYMIASGGRHSLDFVCTGSELGACSEKIELEFEEGFSAHCVACVNVVDPLEQRLLPSSVALPLSKKTHSTVAATLQNRLWTVPGERLPMRQAKLPDGLPRFPVNAMFWSMSPQELENFVGGSLRQPLCPENYLEKLQLLLHLEEVHLSRELEERVLCPALLKLEGHLVRISLASWLEEAQFPPRVGDRVVVRPAGAVSNEQLNYEGFVHEVMSDDAVLRFSLAFNEELLKSPGQTWQLFFQLNRTPLRRCHLAVRLSRPLLRSVLFPRAGVAQSPTSKKPLKLVNEQLNELQQEAVHQIMAGSRGPLPYVVWGPPGTGKTVTLVEAILQVFLNIKHSRLIACAPSNSAADLLTEKLWASGKLVSSDIVRLLGYHRDVDAVPPTIRHLCMNTGAVKKAARHRIVVSTVITAGALYSLGLPPDHFTHGFLDEAGQATEPETLVVMGLVCLAGGSFVLGGDPMQLGPVVRSRLAIKGGLGESLLHRLLLGSGSSGDPTLPSLPFTRLRNSYRCVQTLLEPYSRLFYDSQLLSCVGDRDRWNLPDFPVLFRGVRGCAQREGSCPSWFNPSEAVIVTQYLQLAFGPWGLLPEQVGVVTPYRKQVQKLRLLMDSLDLPRCKLGSAEEFQGQERSLIIVSTVRGSETMSEDGGGRGLDFIFCPRRFNVAISRASSMLVVVGNPDVLALDANWRFLIDYCSAHKTCHGLM